MYAAAADAFRHGDFAAVIAACDPVIASSSGDELVRVLYLRARALDRLERFAEAMRAWQRVLEQPAVNDQDEMLSTKVLYSLALAQYQHEHDVTAALQAGQAFARELANPHPERTTWYLAGRANWLMTTLAGAGALREGGELAAALLAADLPQQAGRPRELIVRNAQLMGSLAALARGDSDRAAALTDQLTDGGEIALTVIDAWLERLEREDGRGRGPQIASGANLRALTLARLGRAPEALAVLRAARARFGEEPDEQIRLALRRGEEIARQIGPP